MLWPRTVATLDTIKTQLLKEKNRHRGIKDRLQRLFWHTGSA